ncbi:MAG: hypothetical protein M3115_01005 [Thermoproteota archaeon]|nr:hypothetical protein [Thermoproteota archaeon]
MPIIAYTMIFFDDRLTFVFRDESGNGKKQQDLFHLISLVRYIGKNSNVDSSTSVWLLEKEKGVKETVFP